ncbi:hypothetical protein [Bosea sp. (in: a-proteobacteria)]|uniref:hypothetical protein n=1 Tax=Bosea sp. (in: a-proteobacteria) TaxID=1871050 RepID=UPI003B3A55AA
MRFPVAFAAICAGGLLTGGAARAQSLLPMSGFATLPSFAWDQPSLTPKWEGSYARISSGFQVTSGKHIRTSAGPTIGLEAGTLRREGNFVYGIVGAIDYAPAIGGYGTPSFGNVAYTRDVVGAFQIKAGVLATPDVLLYTSVGMSAGNETWRYGATPFSSPFSRSEIAARPEARAGVEWQVTDKLKVGLEVGFVGQQIR